MQPILNHLDNIVRPAVRDYAAAESALDAAHIAKDANAIDATRKNVMRKARIAATELHHLQDFVLHNPQPALSFARIEDIRSALRAACVFGRETVAVHHPKQLRRLDEGARPAGTADGTILSADSTTRSAPKSPAPFSDGY